MKKILLLLPLALMLVMCKSTKRKTTATSGKISNISYSEKFKGASAAETATLLKTLDASAETKSVLVLTQNFIGGEVTVVSAGKQVYKGYPITDKSTGLAERIAISNTADTRVLDSYTGNEVVLSASDTKKYKFAYVARTGKPKPAYKVLYSTKLKVFKPKKQKTAAR